MRMTLEISGYEHAAAAATAAGLEVQEHSPSPNHRTATLWRNGHFVGTISPSGSFSQSTLFLDSHRNTRETFTAIFRHLEGVSGSTL